MPAPARTAQEDITLATELERQFLDNRKSRFEILQFQEAIRSLQQETALKQKFSSQILIYLWLFSGFCGGVILCQGFHVHGFSLETTPLTTLIGGTAVSAFGLVSVMLRGLFGAASSGPGEKTSEASKKGLLF